MRLIDGEIIDGLASLNRRRATFQRMRISQENLLHVTIATAMFGYTAARGEADRKELYNKAVAYCKEVGKCEDAEAAAEEYQYGATVWEQCRAIASTKAIEDSEERLMVKMAKKLPVAAWADAPEQNGFGLASLAKIVALAGDLCNFPNPAKLLRFLSLSPYTSGGVTRHGSAWRRFGGLTAHEWTQFGYSPRRRSMMFVIAGNLIKNGTPKEASVTKAGVARGPKIETPYRRAFDEARASFAAKHPGASKMHTLRHGQLITVRKLVINLWVAWVEAAGATRGELRERFDRMAEARGAAAGELVAA